MVNLSKLPNETEKQYLWRVGLEIENGTAGVTWEEATPYINKEWRKDESEYRTSSAYRKPIQYAIPFYEEVFSKMTPNDYSSELNKQKDELYKLKRQMYDQRREYNKLLTIDARAEHLHDEIVRCAEEINYNYPLLPAPNWFDDINTKDEAVVCFADWHYGMVTDNIWNKYDTNICKRRVSEVVTKMKKILKKNQVIKLHILLLGDAAHGAIHTTTRVASEEKVCDQIMSVSELIAEAINELSECCPYTYVYSTYGNHLRTIQNKKDSTHEDNMEKLISWWLKERFKDREDIEIIDSEFQEIIPVRVCGYNIVATHGDLDNIKNIGVVFNTVFSKLYGEGVDYTISADRHHLESFESYGIENIIVRALCGTDDYAHEHRLYSDAGQSLMLFNDEGKYCQYDIKVIGDKYD